MVLARYGEKPAPDDAKLLGQSLVMPFSGKVAKSRFLKGAMTERMYSWDQLDLSKRGIPSDQLVRLYEEWGKGGYGIVLTGNVMIDPKYLESPGNGVLYAPHETPERLEQFRRVAVAGKRQGSLMVMQISHCGRQVPAYINPSPVSAGNIKLPDQPNTAFGAPTPLTKGGIKEVIDQFVYAAEAAYRTGFDGVQLHAAHGYLLAQFLAQTTNNRSDEYGGSIQNRSRVIQEIVEGIRATVPDTSFIIGIKINSVEFQPKGFQPEEAAELCKELEAMRIDFVELSGGTYEDMRFHHSELNMRESTKKREAFFAEFAAKIVPSLKKAIPYVTGGFRTAAGMADAVRSGLCAGVGIGRPATSDPYLPADIISGRTGGATLNKLPAQDFWIQALASGVQMEAIARGQPVFDISDPKELQRFKEAASDFQKQKEREVDTGAMKPGYFVLGALEVADSKALTDGAAH